MVAFKKKEKDLLGKPTHKTVVQIIGQKADKTK
jgi:hypothetical protein